MPFTPLSESPEFNFPAGAFDVRGWEVRTMADGEKVGEVDDLLVDDHGNVRYLDVDLGLLRKHVLLPIGQARVDEAEDAIWVPGMTKGQFKEIPPYAHDVGTLTPDYERRLEAAYTGAHGAAGGGGRRPAAGAAPADAAQAGAAGTAAAGTAAAAGAAAGPAAGGTGADRAAAADRVTSDQIAGGRADAGATGRATGGQAGAPGASGPGAGESAAAEPASGRRAGGGQEAEAGATRGRLESLGDLDEFKVAEEDPDPRDWLVIAADDRAIGRVHELVVDTTAMKVRYLDCRLDAEALGIEEERHVLVPIGYARLDEEKGRVIVDALESTAIARLPAFGGLPVTRDYEHRLHQEYTGGGTS